MNAETRTDVVSNQDDVDDLISSLGFLKGDMNGFEPDEEILQDFLVEAGELLEKLSEQLVELNRTEDRDLLNAISEGSTPSKGLASCS